MRASRVLGVLAGTAAIALATLTVAAPAAAATLPPGQKITVSQNDSPPVGPPAVQLFDANPGNAALSAVGPVAGGAVANSIDVDDTGHGFGVGNRTDGENITSPYLYTVDANTGALTNEVEIVPVDEELDLTQCTAIDYSGGEIVVACFYAPDILANSFIGTVTPAGAFTPFYDAAANEDTLRFFSAIAHDAVTGQLWVFASAGGPTAYLVDRAAGELGEPIPVDLPVFGADFDRGGQLWVTTEVDPESPADNSLATADPASGTVTTINTFSSADGPEFAIPGITVWGALAATGASDAELIPVGLGTALLLLAGAAFIATARLRRSA